MNRKSVALLLSLILFIVSSPTGFAASRIGDANGDGRITAADARIVLRVAAGLTTVSDKSLLDVDGNDIVTSSDARYILRFAAKLENAFPAEELVPAVGIGDVNAESALLYHMNADTVLYRKNTSARIAPASLVKLLTSLTALRYCPEDTVFTVGDEIDLRGYNSSVCYLQKGWRASLKTLITGMLSSSGNDAAYCIAVNVAKQFDIFSSDAAAVQYFMNLMNAAAKEIGMTDSHFINPDGYDAEGQYTTAADLLLLAKAAVKNELIKHVCSQYRSAAYLADGGGVTWYNTNRMLNPNDAFYRPEVTGLKTGSTAAAGSCVIITFTRAGREYIAIVLGAPSDEERYKTAGILIDAAE